MTRFTRQVLDDHLCLRECGKLLEDIDADCAKNVCGRARLVARNALRVRATRLQRQLSGGAFPHVAEHVKSESALQRQCRNSSKTILGDGAGSFALRADWIVPQNIYKLHPGIGS